MTLIIAFNGKIKSGKDKNCDFLVRNAPEFFPGKTIKKYGFATRLKMFCHDFFDIPEKNLWGTNEEKNELIHIKWQDLPNYLTILESCRRKAEQKPVGRLRARDLMQHIGDGLRQIYPKCWINQLRRDIEADSKYIDIALICDLRYPNEADFVHEKDGKVIRLTRAVPPLSEHISETAMDNYDNFDCVIDNHNLSIDETHHELINYLKSIELIK